MKKILFLLLCCGSQMGYAQYSREDFPDVLKLGYQVQKANRIETNVFSDLGAWHAYTLPLDSNGYGSFTGPLVMDLKGQWLANSMAILSVRENGKVIDLKNAKAELHYYPGMLLQEMHTGDLKIVLKLIFISSREALVQTQIQNLSEKPRGLELGWSGKVILENPELKKTEKGISVRFDQDHSFYLNFSVPVGIELSKDGYQAKGEALKLKAGGVYTTTYTQGYHPEQRLSAPQSLNVNFTKELKANQQRWNNYLKLYFNAPGAKVIDPVQCRIAVKSIVTLITNWRVKAKDLLHDGVFPSLNYQGFYGFWSWDSWKQAVGLSYFNPELAKNNIRSMFDYQDAQGMIADCVYTDQKENNWRDTKPPLAAWAVWKIHELSPDHDFLKSMYPKLVKYHHWWYQNRDHNKNGLCEYGSTDGTRIAAAWESGMDNAVRFDKATLFQNNASAWSLNQESVDLNAYLYAEKDYLARIASVIGLDKEAQDWKAQLPALKKLINKTFYHHDKAYYYDRLLDGQWLDVDGPEGWIPLWCGIADAGQAEGVRKMMLDEHKFNTKVPLPTLAADHPKFDPLKGYWRGPVWLDQVYFGLKGLRNYGYGEDSGQLLIHLLNHAEGLSSQGPIRENYHPISGKGLNAMNFSWSAAHILMLLKENQ